MLGREAHHGRDRVVELQRRGEGLRRGGKRVEMGARDQRSFARSGAIDRLRALLPDRAQQRQILVAEIGARRVGRGERADHLATEEQRHADERVIALLPPAGETRIATIALRRGRDDHRPDVADRLGHRDLVLESEFVPVPVIVGFVAGEPAHRHTVVLLHDADGRRAGARRSDALVQHRLDHLVQRRGTSERGRRVGQHLVATGFLHRELPRLGLRGEQPGRVDRQRRAVGDLLGELQVRLRVALVGFRTDQRDRTDRVTASGQRHHHRAMQMQIPHRLEQRRVIDQAPSASRRGSSR